MIPKPGYLRKIR